MASIHPNSNILNSQKPHGLNLDFNQQETSDFSKNLRDPYYVYAPLRDRSGSRNSQRATGRESQ